MYKLRIISLLAVLGLVDFSIISLYQVGLIKHLPYPPGKIFDSDKANGSHHAYVWGVPDGPLAIGIYALSLILATIKGDKKKWKTKVG